MIPRTIPVDLNVANFDCILDVCLLMHRNREPLRALPRLDAISITPTMFVILHVVVKDENIRFLDLVEVASPWDIGGLQNRAGHTMAGGLLTCDSANSGASKPI